METAIWILVGIGVIQLFYLSIIVGKLNDIFNIVFDISSEVNTIASPIYEERLDEERLKHGIIVDKETGEVI